MESVASMIASYDSEVSGETSAPRASRAWADAPAWRASGCPQRLNFSELPGRAAMANFLIVESNADHEPRQACSYDSFPSSN
jgi:hypothetical protein